MKSTIAKVTTSLLLAVILVGCSDELKTNQVKTDMSRSDLIDVMGEPDYIEDNADKMYAEVKPIYATLIELEGESKSKDTSKLSYDEQKRYETLATSLSEVSDIINAISQGNGVERYDYFDEKIEYNGNIDKADMEVYVLNGRVIYSRTVASE